MMTTAVSRILLSSRCAYMGRDGVSTCSVMGFPLVNKCFIHSAGNVLVDKRVRRLTVLLLCGNKVSFKVRILRQ